MDIQISGLGLALKDALKKSCLNSTHNRFQSLTTQSLRADWRLLIEKGRQTAKLTWVDGKFKGYTKAASNDMYQSIHDCLKKASEQMKKAHKRVIQRPRVDKFFPVEECDGVF